MAGPAGAGGQVGAAPAACRPPLLALQRLAGNRACAHLSGIVQREAAEVGPAAPAGQPLPADPVPWHGIELLPLVEEDELPGGLRAPVDNGHLLLGPLLLVPQVRDLEAPAVVYYRAVDAHSGAPRLAIGPAELADFTAHLSLYLAAMGNFFSLLGGDPSPQVISNVRTMRAGLRGDARGLLRYFVETYAAALTSPAWWVRALGAAVVASAPVAPRIPGSARLNQLYQRSWLARRAAARNPSPRNLARATELDARLLRETFRMASPPPGLRPHDYSLGVPGPRLVIGRGERITPAGTLLPRGERVLATPERYGSVYLHLDYRTGIDFSKVDVLVRAVRSGGRVEIHLTGIPRAHDADLIGVGNTISVGRIPGVAEVFGATMPRPAADGTFEAVIGVLKK